MRTSLGPAQHALVTCYSVLVLWNYAYGRLGSFEVLVVKRAKGEMRSLGGLSWSSCGIIAGVLGGSGGVCARFLLVLGVCRISPKKDTLSEEIPSHIKSTLFT